MSSIAPSRRLAPYSTKTPFFHRLARKTMFGLLERISHGQITLIENGTALTFGADTDLHVQLTIHDQAAYTAMLFGGSVGAGESYIEGYWEADNLTALMRIMVLNMGVLDDMERGLAWILWPYRWIQHLRRENSKKSAKKNILSHYDLGNELYQAFLDPTMMYSSAIYPDQTSSLEEAALFKLDRICQKLQLQPTDQVVEIGSGWGGFAIHAAANYGCHVTTTTISEAQFTEASKRIKAAGLNDRITLLRNDYRDLHGSFDKLVSIEMIEAVGHRYLPEFFRTCGNLLKQDGLLLLQAITLRDQKYRDYLRQVDYIQKHIFPGGCLVTNTTMLELLRKKTDMVVASLDDFGFDYARTLQDWRHRFLDNFQQLMSHGFDERFKRLWEFYLCYCEGGFLERSISVVQLLAAKPDNRLDLRTLN